MIDITMNSEAISVVMPPSLVQATSSRTLGPRYPGRRIFPNVKSTGNLCIQFVICCLEAWPQAGFFPLG